MDRLLLEKLAKELYDIRFKKKQIDSKELELRTKIIELLDKDSKTTFSFNEWVIHKKIKYIKTIKPNLVLPDDSYEIKKVFQLFVKNEKDIELIGNKFVFKKK